MTQSKLLTLLQEINPTFALRQSKARDIVAVWCDNKYSGYRINAGEIPYKTFHHPTRGKIRGYRELSWLLESKKLITLEQATRLRNAQQ